MLLLSIARLALFCSTLESNQTNLIRNGIISQMNQMGAHERRFAFIPVLIMIAMRLNIQANVSLLPISYWTADKPIHESAFCSFGQSLAVFYAKDIKVFNCFPFLFGPLNSLMLHMSAKQHSIWSYGYAHKAVHNIALRYATNLEHFGLFSIVATS